MLLAPAATSSSRRVNGNSSRSQREECGFDPRREYVIDHCGKHCPHGGICTVAGEHETHDTGYCTFTDDEAISRVEADAMIYASGNGSFVDLQDTLESLLGIDRGE
jgi:hypothetical protein